MIFLRLATLTGKFSLGDVQHVETEAEALTLINAHARSGNFTDVKRVHEDVCSVRYTARTPGGRHGRNIAFIDYE
jgi:hypothetical protein